MKASSAQINVNEYNKINIICGFRTLDLPKVFVNTNNTHESGEFLSVDIAFMFLEGHLQR